MSEKNISVCMATYKRPESLRCVLESFARMRTGSLSWEVLVCDNAGDVATKNVAESFRPKLDIHYFVRKEKGQNRALNRLLPEVKGEIVAITDDDVIADNDWLLEIWQGVHRWPDHSIFGGRIIPQNPEIIPEIYKRLWFYPYTYAIADWGLPEGPYCHGRVFGPNMAFRSHLFRKGYRFDESLSSPSDGYIGGDETEFMHRMQIEGYGTVYLPNALIFHSIRKEQTSLEWVLKRGFYQGRSVANLKYCYDEKAPCIFGFPWSLFRESVERVIECLLAHLSRNRIKMIENAYHFQVLRGKFYQYWRFRNFDGVMND